MIMHYSHVKYRHPLSDITKFDQMLDVCYVITKHINPLNQNITLPSDVRITTKTSNGNQLQDT
jgi:hypothetical protein